jgi:AraC family transcriptional regulator, chitin signaling transcriptional activator
MLQIMIEIANGVPTQKAGNNFFSVLVTILFFLASHVPLQAQDQPVVRSIKGTPRVIHYTRKDFNSDPQIWAMCQDKEGILYFGSNNGTLIFDGERWQKVAFPNNSSVRSLAVSKDGTVFAGGFNEFGTIRKDEFGTYNYTSLVPLLRVEDQNIENIWAIHEAEGYLIFRSYKLIIAIANNKAITVSTTNSFEYSTVLNDQLFIYDSEGVKILDLKTFDFRTVFTPSDLRGENFLAILPGFGEHPVLAITKQGSLYSVDPENRKLAFVERLLPSNAIDLITGAVKSSSGHYYLGTLSSKVIMVTTVKDRPSVSEVFHELQDHTVHNLFESREGNIWALLNNGIDCIDVNSPVTLLFDNASIFDVLIKRQTMYLATNQGVFMGRINQEGNVLKSDFRKIPGLEGQAWSLQEYEGQVICGHDQGVVVLSENRFVKADGAKGIWKVIAVEGRPGKYLACAYDGLYLMTSDQRGTFRVGQKLDGFNESSRDILQADEPGVFWICHGYKGVFRIRTDAGLSRVTSVEHFKDNGLPSSFNINVWRWQGEVVFTTNKGIFSFDEQNKKFQIHSRLSSILGTEMNVRQLLEAGDQTWFIHNDEVGFFNSNETAPVLNKGLFLQLKGTFNESMECIVPVSAKTVVIGTRDGLYAFDLDYHASKLSAKTMISSVSYRAGGEVKLCALTDAVRAEFPHGTQSIHFAFAVPDFDDKINTQYSFKIDGVRPEWSEWQEQPHAEFSLLPSGTYTLHVRARSLFGENASDATFSFSIIPVWYKTSWAYALYALFSLVLALSLVQVIRKRIEFVKRRTRGEEEEKRKVLQLELEHIKLEREKEEIIKHKDQLEEDVVFKSKELANYTMLLVKKREFLSDMFEQIGAIKEVVRNDQARQGLRDLQKKITSNLQSEEHIRVFEANFERVHHEFFTQLKSTFPDLSAKELQLCAFVKMNLTNKEIASILNLSVRGIETARYRLRKRLGIAQEEDMVEFLERLYSAQDV